MRAWIQRQDRVFLAGVAVLLVGIATRVGVLFLAGLVLETIGLVRASRGRWRRRK